MCLTDWVEEDIDGVVDRREEKVVGEEEVATWFYGKWGESEGVRLQRTLRR